jgi:hypothetical protein
VGRTTTSASTAGFKVEPEGDTYITAEGSDGRALYLNRLTSEGTILELSKDDTTVGSIGVVATNNLYVHGDNIGLGIGDDNLYPTNSAGAANDNAVDLGDASVKWRVVYAGTGSINTSDENEKQQITSLTSAEMTAATAISKLFKNYKWNDAVASKGDDARTHTGVIAQQVQTAMSDAGLDASKYAFWCSNTWWEKEVEVAAVEANEEKLIKAQDAYTRIDTYSSEEEAPEGAVKKTRMGIRYAELLSFIGAATEQRLTSIEARLTALEG